LAIDIGEKYKKRAVKATIFIVGGYGASQVLRLAGNLILTRLLVPEYFGIMALANVVYLGLGLFSDFGISPSIIRSSRSSDTNFLNTAWTIQILRGFMLFLLSVVIAYPVAGFYDESILMLVIPTIGVNSVIIGFQSTSIILLQKELKQGQLTFIELVVQSVGLAFMIVIAYIYKNVWALVIGGLFSSTIKMIWSHLLNTEKPNRFLLEKAAIIELISFGKWIFISTAMMFLATQADRLIFGRIFSLSFLGVYAIAVIFAEIPKKIIGRVSGSVIFPLLTKYSYLSHKELKKKIEDQRSKILIILAFLVGILACFGDFLVISLYDSRYVQASWILPLLAIGIWPLILYATIDRILYVVGKPKYSSIGNLLKFIYMLVFVPFLYRIAGNFGAVLAVALNDIPVYIIINYGLIKENFSLKKQDALSTLVLLIIICFLIIVRFVFGLGFPGVASFPYN